MTRKQRIVAKDASDAFWHAVNRAVALDDLAALKEAVRQIRQVSPVAAIAIADVIEADEEPEEAPPFVRWLVSALRGEVVSVLH